MPSTLLGSFDEAIEALRKRVPITDAELQLLTAEARRKAFWVAGVQQLNAVQIIQDAIQKAITEGQTLDAFRASVRGVLVEKCANHTELVYRNATQTAYNVGRKEQMSAPAVKRVRPYWMLATIDDDRRSDICEELAGMVLSADDPAWARYTPPLHHGCRSYIRALRRSEAEARGISDGPAVNPQEGFGSAQTANDNGEGIAAGHDPGLVGILQRRAATAGAA